MELGGKYFFRSAETVKAADGKESRHEFSCVQDGVEPRFLGHDPRQASLIARLLRADSSVAAHADSSRAPANAGRSDGNVRS